MVDFYVRQCENNSLSFNDVPDIFKTEVSEKLTEDGYIVVSYGEVIKRK